MPEVLHAGLTELLYSFQAAADVRVADTGYGIDGALDSPLTRREDVLHVTALLHQERAAC